MEAGTPLSISTTFFPTTSTFRIGLDISAMGSNQQGLRLDKFQRCIVLASFNVYPQW
jgi:hypothetical protein